MTADSDDTIPERVEDDEMDDPMTAVEEDGDGDEEHHDSIIDHMRGSGVGLEDPDIVGDPHPSAVDAEIAEDEAPLV